MRRWSQHDFRECCRPGSLLRSGPSGPGSSSASGIGQQQQPHERPHAAELLDGGGRARDELRPFDEEAEGQQHAERHQREVRDRVVPH